MQALDGVRAVDGVEEVGGVQAATDKDRCASARRVNLVIASPQ